MARRRKKFGEVSEANSFYRAATVHLEEAKWQAENGNCFEAVRRLAEGSRALGSGQALNPQMGRDSDMASFRDDAVRSIHTKCLRGKK